MRWTLRAAGVRLCVAALVTLAAVGLAGAECRLPDTMQADVRPDPGGPPTEVGVRIMVLDVMGIDDVSQQIDADFYMVLHWRDPRLAGAAGCRFPSTEVWHPEPVLVNSSNLRLARTQGRNVVAVEAGGSVFWGQRTTGTISSYHVLRDFPFDSHRIELRFAPEIATRDELVFVPDPRGPALGDRLNIEGWSIGGLELTEATAQSSVGERELSQLTLTIGASRDSAYYVWRLLLPLLAVVAMSWVVFWIPPERYEFQIGLGATSMLTAIAFAVSLSNRLPTLGYLTVMDWMLVWAILLILAAIIEALVVGRLFLAKRHEEAERIDRTCRWVFPLLLAVGWGAMIA